MAKTKKTTQASAAPVVQEAQAQAPLNISLDLKDIQDALQCIDFAAEQGAYKGWNTIRQVFTVRERLNAFLTEAARAAGDQTPPADDAAQG